MSTHPVTLADLNDTVAQIGGAYEHFRQLFARAYGSARLAEMDRETETDEPPTECPNCRRVIGDHDSFCDEKCRAEFLGEDSATDDPNKPGRGMSL